MSFDWEKHAGCPSGAFFACEADRAAMIAEGKRLEEAIRQAYFDVCGALMWGYDSNAAGPESLARATRELLQLVNSLPRRQLSDVLEIERLEAQVEQLTRDCCLGEDHHMEHHAREVALEDERDRLREALALVLPMAKAWAHEHDVGGNWQKCESASVALDVVKP